MIARRLVPQEGKAIIAAQIGFAVLAAFCVTGVLFLLQGTNPLQAYLAMFSGGFASARGFGYALVKASPLSLIALGTIVAWRSGFGYLGFEGCFALGAAGATAVALMGGEGHELALLPPEIIVPLVLLASFAAGGAWAGLVGIVRARFGGNEVLISLMSNYLGLLLVQYLVSGPMRAPGGLAQSDRIPASTWLPFIIPGTRAHEGILLAVLAACLVWVLLRKTPAGYELIVTGLNPVAARYGGINVVRRLMLASVLAGGLGGLAGAVELLGVQHRLLDGMSGGVGFIGIVVALLARLNPLAVLPTAILYGGMSVGADAMQRTNGVPSSIAAILQSLIVMFVMAGDMLRFYRIGRRSPSPRVPDLDAAQAAREVAR